MAQFWRGAATQMVQAFAGGMIAGLLVGYETFDKGSLPWLDAFYIGIGCAIIAPLLALAGGPVFTAFRNRRKATAPIYEQQNVERHENTPAPEPHIPHVHHVEEQAKPTEAEKDDGS
jgi:MFS family permease